MTTAKAHGMLIEPTDVTVFPHDKTASPNGVEYIGKIEVLDVTGGTDLQITTYGGVQKTLVVAVGAIIEGPITSIDAATGIDRCRVHYLSAP